MTKQYNLILSIEEFEPNEAEDDSQWYDTGWVRVISKANQEDTIRFLSQLPGLDAEGLMSAIETMSEPDEEVA